MTHAFLFLPEIIRFSVDKGKPGVYALGEIVDGKFIVGYVGRSDSCVQTRLLSHNHLYEFSYFCFQYARNPAEAYLKETELWHTCVDFDIPIVNKIHPDSPANAKLSCPYCQSAKIINQSLKNDWLQAG